MAFDPLLGKLVLYGGASYLCQVTKPLSENLNTTWLWNGHRWLATDPPGSPVESPDEGGVVYDSRLDELVMVDVPLNGPKLQTWLFNGKRWQQVHPKVSPPDGLVYLSYDAATGHIILLTADRTDSVWVFNGETWGPGPAMPELRTFSPLATVYDPTLRSVIAIGRLETGGLETLILGKKGGEPLDTTGVLPTVEPFIVGLAMAFDQRLHEVVLYYGNPAFATVPPVNETWVLRGKDWIELLTAANPSVRKLPSLACWDAKGDVVLFGGVGETRFDNDLWRFTGTDWVRVSYAATAAA